MLRIKRPTSQISARRWRLRVGSVLTLILLSTGVTSGLEPANANDQLAAKISSVGRNGNSYANYIAFEVDFSGSKIAKANDCKDVMAAVAESSTVTFSTSSGAVSDKLTDYYDSWSPSYPFFATGTVTATSIACIFYRSISSNPTVFNAFTSGMPTIPSDVNSTPLKVDFLYGGTSLASADATVWKPGYLGSISLNSPTRGQILGKTFSVSYSLDKNPILTYSNLQLSACPQEFCGSLDSGWSFDYGSGSGYVASASLSGGTIKVALTKNAPDGTYFVSLSTKTDFDGQSISTGAVAVTVDSKSSSSGGSDWASKLALINGQTHYINTSVDCGSSGIGFGVSRSCKVVLDAQDGISDLYPVSIYESIDGVRTQLKVIQMPDKGSSSFTFVSPKKFSALSISAEIDGVNSSIGHWTPAGWDDYPRFQMSVPSSVRWGGLLTVKISATKKASGYCDLVTGASSYSLQIKGGVGSKVFKLVWAGGIGSTTKQFFTATCVSGNHPAQTLMASTVGYR